MPKPKENKQLINYAAVRYKKIFPKKLFVKTVNEIYEKNQNGDFIDFEPNSETDFEKFKFYWVKCPNSEIECPLEHLHDTTVVRGNIIYLTSKKELYIFI